MKKIPVLVYTDIGDDIDDSLAIAYLLAHPDIELVGIICEHKNIAYRRETAQHLLDILNVSAPIAEEEHADFLEHILKTYHQDLVVLSIAPTTQLHKDMECFPDLFRTIKRIYFQGQLHIHEKNITPNMQSYNFAQDQKAIQHILEYDIPMTFVGKYIAYEVPFKTQDFNILAKKNPRVWEYLYEEATKWKERLEKINGEVFQRLYAKESDIMSYPYDLITAVAITNDEMFIKTIVGNREYIGQEKDLPGIKDISVFKKFVVDIL